MEGNLLWPLICLNNKSQALDCLNKKTVFG